MNIRELGAEDLAPLLGLYTHLHEHDDPLPSEPEVQAVWTEALAWRERCYKVMLMTGRKDENTLRFFECAWMSTTIMFIIISAVKTCR